MSSKKIKIASDKKHSGDERFKYSSGSTTT